MAKRKNPKKRRIAKGRSPATLRALAEQAQQGGRPKKAMQYLRKAIAQNPRDSRAFFHLGNLLLGKGRAKDALTCYEKALAVDPKNLAVQLNRANALQQLEQLEQARAAYQNILAERPDLAAGQFNLGLVLQQLGNLDGAVAAFRQALELQPELSIARHNLAKALISQGQLRNAVGVYQSLLSDTPDNVTACRELGDVLQSLGAYSQAEKAYRVALNYHPNHAETFYSIGTAQQQQAQYDHAIDSYRKSIELKPRQLQAYASLGNALHQVGRVEEAIEQYRAALEVNPAFAHARFGICISQLPIIYHDEKEIQDARQNYSNALEELYEYYLDANLEERARAAGAVGSLQPFYLSYQGLPVRDLQKQYARLISLLVEARYPEFVNRLDMPVDTGKIRLGVVSGFLRNHSSWNIFQGLFEALDRSRFELYMFHTRNQRDRETRLLENLCDGFVQGPLSVNQWARTIREQRLHALFFPEFGMEPTAIQLGCLRLAPVQLTSWGHPVTSGLDTIDYYLSSALMESDNAQDDYSETLVPLPNLSMHYRLPTVDPEAMSREDLDVPDDAVIYWCCQSLFKYLPQHDDVFPRIARQVNQAVFLFLSLHGGIVEERFKERLAAAFASEGLDMDDFCHFLSKLPKPTFAAMTALSDIFLDSIGWSGCNSSMEAIAADRPIMTLPGDFMRGRHTQAFLEMMGLDEWIAADKDEYVEMAVRLGSDEPLRRSLSGLIRERKTRLYRDPEPVRALESLLEQAVASYEPKASDGDAPAESVDELLVEKEEGFDDSEAQWNTGVRCQRQGKLNMAASAFRRSLELKNPHYAAAQPIPRRALRQPVVPENGKVELEGLSYPAIMPVVDSDPRPFWSVVIPVYNRDKFLLECLASVLAQWPDDESMEIIVIDNGSDPSLEELVDSIGKGIVFYHRHPETLSLQRNWNSAVSASRGQWVHLLHDDDYVLPGFYPALQKGLKDCPETIGAAFTAYENINENDEVVFRNPPFGGRRGIADGWIEKIGVCNVLNPPAVVVRREAYERLGGYSNDILYTTDWEMYLRLVSFYDWWYEPEILVRYRQHAFNVTTEQNRAGAQGEAFWRAIEMAEYYLPVKVRDRIITKSRHYYFNWCLRRLRLPMQAGNQSGALRLLREMLRIDRTEDSLLDLFDWLGTTFASPLWPAIIEAYQTVSAQCPSRPFSDPGLLFDWLRTADAANIRIALADALMEAPAVHTEDKFRFTS